MRICDVVRPVLLALLVAASGALQACSVGMALSGSPEPNISVLEIGQSRDIVLLNLGEPSQTFAIESGRTDVFHLERGNAPSAGRAIGHAAMDVLTFGIWELIGAPVEGFMGETVDLTIQYDADDMVKSIRTSQPNRSF